MSLEQMRDPNYSSPIKNRNVSKEALIHGQLKFLNCCANARKLLLFDST